MKPLTELAVDGLSFSPHTGSSRKRIGIIGGGPGGLITAFLLNRACGDSVDVTLYEATDRLGGKILTRSFATVPVLYEAGAAELYDYSRTGEDPLRDMIEEFGLSIRQMNGTGVVLDGQALYSLEDVRSAFGSDAYQALVAFDRQARERISPEDYYSSDWEGPTPAPTTRTFYDELLSVPNPVSRRFLHTLVHSDLATEPHRTSVEYGLQNYLMNHPEYMQLYSIEGGIERLPRELARRISADVRLNQPVSRVETTADGRLQVVSREENTETKEAYDFVVVALPHSHLSSIHWAGDALGPALHQHIAHHDYPGHYLRVSVLFRRPFWEQELAGSYMMLDAFGGCCLYDESSRGACAPYGILGWLLAGDQAMTAANLKDDRLIQMALDSLPPSLQQGKELFLEGQVHRWIGAVSGLPCGRNPLPIERRHRPCSEHPNLFTVGDYLFDATLNGVLDSAAYVAETLADELQATASVTASHKSKTRQ